MGASAGLGILVLLGLGAIVVGAVIFFAMRYKRCPSDMILVVYGRVGEGQSARCIHGGGAFVWPLIQDYSYMPLTPMTINIPLQNALSLQNIRIDVPSTFTVGISTNPQIMTNAAERLLNQSPREIENMAKEIIFGQLRLTVASLTIEQINQDRESFLAAIRQNVEPELNKVGLYLINVNITDITDESEYIMSIGKKAASEAVNRARVDVAEQEKMGFIGQAEANREKEIRVAEAEAESEKGKKKADSEKRIYIQQQEAEAIKGENLSISAIADSDAGKEVRIAEANANTDKGKKKADAEKRIYVQQQESEAIKGENLSNAEIADSDAELNERRAEAQRRGEVAQRMAEVEIQKAQAKAETERLTAQEVVRQEIDKQKVEIAAEAEAEKKRREARGEADAVLARYTAEAEGLQNVLESKARGYSRLVESCEGDAKAAATFLLVEKLEQIVQLQVEAIKSIKIDKVTVWDSADGNNSSTANFMKNLVKSLPPLHDVAAMAGMDLPEYLGTIATGDPDAEPGGNGGSRGPSSGGSSSGPESDRPASAAGPETKTPPPSMYKEGPPPLK